MDVVGEWQASHFGWSDTLSIFDNGRFARGNGDEGSWHVKVEGGKTILALDWDRCAWDKILIQIHSNPR
jgi:hypothetical protein